ncbi:MAG TPA: DUF1127 domain-containing protein [Stellaceae bacterium]|nr:DUF1127 domain-containing protein [Stellaceae bacterium]
MTDIDCGRLIISQEPDLLTRLLARLDCWRRRIQGRADLALLDERSLRDIGVSPAQARYEASKPFWRA